MARFYRSPQRSDMSEVEGQADITRTSSISVVDPTLTLDTAFTRGVAKGPRASAGAEFAQIIQAPSRGSGHGTSERWFGLPSSVLSKRQTPWRHWPNRRRRPSALAVLRSITNLEFGRENEQARIILLHWSGVESAPNIKWQTAMMPCPGRCGARIRLPEHTSRPRGAP
jgi:hypothetical protein